MGTRPAHAGHNALILMVEDHQDSRDMYREWLQHVGSRVVSWGNGDEALRTARELHPDAIATELELRCSDGQEFCAALKADRRTANIPVVVVTSWATEAYLSQVRYLGCADILIKPVLPGTMAEALARALGDPDAGPAARRQTPRP
jgi:two-component system, cell cycle response regulator DivK